MVDLQNGTGQRLATLGRQLMETDAEFAQAQELLSILDEAGEDTTTERSRLATLANRKARFVGALERRGILEGS